MLIPLAIHKPRNDDATEDHRCCDVNGIFTDVTMMSSLDTALPSKNVK